MPNIYLDKNNEFVVKEWKTINYVIGIFLLLLLIMIVYSMGIEANVPIEYVILLGLPIFIVILISQKKAIQNVYIFRINDEGIYYYGKHVTDWDNFQKAYITDEQVPGRFSDNFKLVIEFYRDSELIRKKIRLTNTQNRSEEEIYAAIMYFHRQHLNANAETIDADAEPLKQLSQ